MKVLKRLKLLMIWLAFGWCPNCGSYHINQTDDAKVDLFGFVTKLRCDTCKHQYSPCSPRLLIDAIG